MYFPHAFKKVFIPKVESGTLSLKSTGKTQDLTPGEIGLYDAKTFQALSASTLKPFMLVQGSYHTTDKLGPFHGGYQESIKSKAINPKYISRFIKIAAKQPQSQVVILGANGAASGGTGLTFRCGHTYFLRMDVKGSPALKFLKHNLYRTFDAFTGCCGNDCSAPCTNDPVDPAIVFKAWADQINGDPIFSNFVKADAIVRKVTQSATGSSGSTTVTLGASNAAVAVGQVVFGTGVAAGAKVVEVSGTTVTLDKANVGSVSGDLVFFDPVTDAYTPKTDESDIESVAASLLISVAYMDTKFGNCTFSVKDAYDLEPLFVYMSVTDDANDPCVEYPVANSSTSESVTELQAPVQASGVGETVIRDYILSQRYLQESFPDGCSIDSLRLREVLDDTALKAVDRSLFYDKILILHNVPRLNNSTSVFDNDQYLLEINVPAGTDTSALTSLIEDILDDAGTGVELEEY